MAKVQEKFQILFCKIYDGQTNNTMKRTPLKRFHLNGHTLGFCL